MAILGKGTTVQFEVTGGSSFTVIANLVSVEGPNITVGEVEATNLSSTWKPYLATIPEGDCTLNIQHVNSDATCIALQALVVVPIPSMTVKIIYSDGYIETFTAYAQGYSVSGIENESIVSASIPVRILTAPTTTAPA